MHELGALSYVVLDVPDPFASAVMAVRTTHGDLFRAALPVEITLTDSFDPSQDADDAFRALDEIAATSSPITAAFSGPHRFPNSDTFVMRLADEEPFRRLRERIDQAGLRFEPESAYEFVPHCTLCTRAPVSDADAEELLTTEIPGVMLLDRLSVYTLMRASTPAGVRVELRHRARLAAAV